MRLISCGDCGFNYSPNATACPRCGAPNPLDADVQSYAQRVQRERLFRILAAIGVLVAVTIMIQRAWVAPLPDATFEASAVEKVVQLIQSWEQRAVSAVERFAASSSGQQQLANLVQKTLHPMGRNPRFVSCRVSQMGPIIEVNASIAWTGWLMEKEQVTSIVWKFNRYTSLGVSVVYDSALLSNPSGLKRLDEMIRMELYPLIAAAAG